MVNYCIQDTHNLANSQESGAFEQSLMQMDRILTILLPPEKVMWP